MGIRSTLVLSAGCLASSAPAALALTPPAATVSGVSVPALETTVRTGDPLRQRFFDRSPAWRGFRARHGPWTAVWNEWTGTPHRAFGRGIALPGFQGDAASADASVRAFVAGNPALFGAERNLQTAAAIKAGRLWYVRYRQTHGGVPLLRADWEFRLSETGRLVAFGVDAHDLPEDTPTRPLIPSAVARATAAARFMTDPTVDRTEGGDDLYLFPVASGDAMGYRLVWDVRVMVADPPGNWIVYVDALSGQIVWSHDRVRYEINGTVSGEVHPVSPFDPTSSAPFPNQYVDVGALQATTGASGAYAASPGGAVTVSAELRGAFCDVNRIDPPADALFSVGATDPSTVDIAWNDGNSHQAERDGFYHVNAAHDYVKALDPGFTGNDYEMPCAVNIANTCNAFWNGIGVNFYEAGNGCPNTATMPDVVYHEYGHGVNDNLYVQAGVPSGMISSTLHEGMADVLAAFMRDDPLIGKDFFGPGTLVRTVDNTARWPDDASGDGHITGLILAGAWWDLRQSLGLAYAAQLSHFTKYGVPDDVNPGTAMSEYFIEALVVDDDDADLSNGTPNGAAISAAFNAHGIGTSFFIEFEHSGIPDQPGMSAYAVRCTVSYAGAFGALDPDSLELFYAVNGAPFQPLLLVPTGNPNEVIAWIPAQQAALVRYYFRAVDTYGGVNFEPRRAPAMTHAFLAGPAVTQFADAFEMNPGWTIGELGDSAATGIWEWGKPVGSFNGSVVVAPDNDYTDQGFNCFFTGNAGLLDRVGTNDVDGGQTTLTSTSFDATTGGAILPVIEYYKWYTNQYGGAPGTDDWVAQISNDDGITWTDIENTKLSTNAWSRVLVAIDDHVTPSTTMRLRFIASDVGVGSIVEAALDDLRLVDFPSLLSAGPGTSASVPFFSPAAPNPFGTTTRLRFVLPWEAPVTLRMLDLQGRVVRTLVNGILGPGEHALSWDGRGDRGHLMPNGLYFAHFTHPGGRIVRSVAIIR